MAAPFLHCRSCKGSHKPKVYIISGILFFSTKLTTSFEMIQAGSLRADHSYGREPLQQLKPGSRKILALICGREKFYCILKCRESASLNKGFMNGLFHAEDVYELGSILHSTLTLDCAVCRLGPRPTPFWVALVATHAQITSKQNACAKPLDAYSHGPGRTGSL